MCQFVESCDNVRKSSNDVKKSNCNYADDWLWERGVEHWLTIPFYYYWYWLYCVDIGDVLTETNTSILSPVEEDLTLSTCLCTAKVSEPAPAAQWLSKQSLMQVLSSPSVQMVAGIFNLALPLAWTCLVNKFNWKGDTWSYEPKIPRHSFQQKSNNEAQFYFPLLKHFWHKLCS